MALVSLMRWLCGEVFKALRSDSIGFPVTRAE